MLNIYIGNLPYDTSEGDLDQLFSQFGQVTRSQIIMDRDTNRSRGFGFVEMAEEADGKTAVESLNGEQFGGRVLTVNEARPRQEGSGGGGSSGYRGRD